MIVELALNLPLEVTGKNVETRNDHSGSYRKGPSAYWLLGPSAIPVQTGFGLA